jgi:hypothetical protein
MVTFLVAIQTPYRSKAPDAPGIASITDSNVSGRARWPEHAGVHGDLYQEARTLAEIAQTLGNRADAATYNALADKIGQAFNATFFNPTANTYQTSVPAGYRQTSNLVPLYYGLVPAGHEAAVYGNLIADIHSHGDHLNTGAVGTKLLLPVLTAHGDTDLAYTIATQTTYPSWGYWVSQGATTSWETWSHTGPQPTPPAGLAAASTTSSPCRRTRHERPVQGRPPRPPHRQPHPGA